MLKSTDTYDLAKKNLEEPVGGYRSYAMSEAGIMANCVPWREQCTRVVLSFFPESVYLARIWNWEKNDGELEFQFHKHGNFFGNMSFDDHDILISVRALCCVLPDQKLQDLVAACALRALDLVGYSDVADYGQMGGRYVSVQTKHHGMVLGQNWDGVVVGEEAEARLRDAAQQEMFQYAESEGTWQE